MAGSTPDLLLQGWRYAGELARRKIPLRHGHVLAGVEAAQGGLQARLAPWPRVGGETSLPFDVDTVLMGYGFMPSNEVLRALGCRHGFDPGRGHLVCERDADCRTSLATVYAVGDCAGLGGARAAEAEGKLAGMAAALSLNLSLAAGQNRERAGARRALRRHRRFQAGVWRLFAAPRPTVELAEPRTFVCRCEELTRAEIDESFAEGPRGNGTIKRATRAGMGRCQGRYCGPLLAAMAARGQDQPLDETGFWAPRPPIKPIAIANIIATSDP